MHVYICICVYIYICIYIYKYVYVYVYVYVYMCIYVYLEINALPSSWMNNIPDHPSKCGPVGTAVLLTNLFLWACQELSSETEDLGWGSQRDPGCHIYFSGETWCIYIIYIYMYIL